MADIPDFRADLVATRSRSDMLMLMFGMFNLYELVQIHELDNYS
jgi:hypothetical protein